MSNENCQKIIAKGADIGALKIHCIGRLMSPFVKDAVKVYKDIAPLNLTAIRHSAFDLTQTVKETRTVSKIFAEKCKMG